MNCTLMRSDKSQGLIFCKYYCLREIFGTGWYLEAVRRKILRVIHRFLVILTIKEENLNARRKKLFYVPQSRKLVFPLQLRVKQCFIFRYRGIQCRNWTAHAHYSLTAERNLFLILLLITHSSYSGTQSISYSSSSHFFFVQR